MCYGTTAYNGEYGGGTAFAISTNGVMKTYSFPGYPTNAASPRGGFVRGPDKALYGTAYFGGVSNLGAVFRMTTNGEESLLCSFRGTNGANPIGTLAGGSNGVFYGVTASGGSSNLGTVFRVTTNGQLATLWHFTGMPDGKQPEDGVILATDGSLYGTTHSGGTNDAGTVFRVTTNGSRTILWSFTWGFDGGAPYAPLMQGKDGALYGTTAYGGTNGFGTVFCITTNGQFTPLWSFTGGTNGGQSFAGLMQVGDWFYGTTTLNDGTIFRFSLAPSIYLHALGSGARVVTWDDSSYILESTTNALGGYTSIAGAFSPYTNTFPDRRRFFRLKLNEGP